MQFKDVDSAVKVLTNEVDLIIAVKEGYLNQIGSPEYGAKLGSYMLKIDEWIQKA
jgi:hypothetical protein